MVKTLRLWRSTTWERLKSSVIQINYMGMPGVGPGVHYSKAPHVIPIWEHCPSPREFRF